MLKSFEDLTNEYQVQLASEIEKINDKISKEEDKESPNEEKLDKFRDKLGELEAIDDAINSLT